MNEKEMQEFREESWAQCPKNCQPQYHPEDAEEIMKNWMPNSCLKHPRKNGWGNNLTIYGGGKVDFIGATPDKHDAILAKMGSGKTAILRIEEIKTPSDPGDLHFIKYMMVCYLEDLPEEKQRVFLSRPLLGSRQAQLMKHLVSCISP